MRNERARLSRHAEVAKAFDYMLKRWPSFARFLDDGRICRFAGGLDWRAANGLKKKRSEIGLGTLYSQ
jgi:hypothetical protein